MNHSDMITRKCSLPEPGQQSFFLWGPRQTGKTTLLRQCYPEPENHWVDLLDNSLYRALSQQPEILRETLLKSEFGAQAQAQVVIDEIQRVPELLAEIHLMIERYGWKFAMAGSSNRKIVKGGHHNLGGRAAAYELRGVTSHELGADFKLEQLLNRGYLPAAHTTADFELFMSGYVEAYLELEIQAARAVRQLPAFRNFLGAAALRDGSPVNYTEIARECGVASVTVREHYEILVETLLGRWLPLYMPRPKGRGPASRKFYFADVGVANFLMKRGALLESETPEFGHAFENWVCHEVSTYLNYVHRNAWERRMSFWKDGSAEVDFLVGDRLAIEAKATERVLPKHLKGLRKLAETHPGFTTRIVVSRTKLPRQTEDGILILGYREFADRLWNGEFDEP